jgi:hypothetical protein
MIPLFIDFSFDTKERHLKTKDSNFTLKLDFLKKQKKCSQDSATI